MTTTPPTPDHSTDPDAWVFERFPDFRLTPGRIAVIYAVFGMVALFVSDVVFVRYLEEPLLSQVQAVKGGVEVLVTAALIFGLTHRSHSQLHSVTDRVEEARDELSLLHRVMRHNLRNDLNIIRGHANMASDDLLAGPAKANCEEILETVEKMMHYSEHARRIRKVTELSPERTQIDLSALIPKVVAEHPQPIGGVDVETSVPETAWVWANPLLAEAISELVENAITHTDADEPEVEIEVAEVGAETMEVRVSDNGPGLPEIERLSLQAMIDSQTVHSAGLGLWFVDWTVTHSGGDLRIERSEAGGTSIVMRLPRVDDSASSATTPLTLA